MTKAQLTFLYWILAAAIGAGIAAYAVGPIAYGIGAILGILVLCLALIYQSFLSSDSAISSDDYFGAQSSLSSRTTLQSIGATWIMLGNVVIANMFLGKAFGLLTAWVVITWAWAFILTSYRVPRIRECLGPADTLHSFLHDAYQSRSMRMIAASITVFVGIGVFSIEVLAGIALLASVLPHPQAASIAPIIVIIVIVAICAAIMTGGLKSVITVDSIFWPAVLISIALLGLLAIAPRIMSAGDPAFKTLVWFPASLEAHELGIFLIGVFALQVPLLLGDFGTWQRIKATKKDETQSLAQLTFTQAGWQSYLWGVPVIAGIFIAAAPELDAGRTGNLYPSAAPLIETVRGWLSIATVPYFVKAAICTVFVAGMLAVMITTANSYLMIALEAWVHDFFPMKERSEFEFGSAIPRDVGRARTLCVLFALLACVPVAIVVVSGMSLLSTILIVFAVQVALAPAAVLALYSKEDARRLIKWVRNATVASFIGAIAFGAFVSYAPVGEWWQSFGPFLTPVFALGIPALTIGFALLSRAAKMSSRAFFWQLLVPRA